MIYLASPYSDPDPAVVLFRYLETRRYTAKRIVEGVPLFSPIVHCHELAVNHDLPKDFAFWQTYNEAILRRALALAVLQLDGWENSKGVRGEIEFAQKYNIPVSYVDP